MVGFRTFIENLDDGSVKSVCSGAKSYPMGTPMSMKMRLGCLKPHPTPIYTRDEQHGAITFWRLIRNPAL